MENLIPRLLKFIDIEYDSQIEDTDKIWKLPIEERVGKGDAITNLQASFVKGYPNLDPWEIEDAMIEDAYLGDGDFIDAITVTFISGQNISKFREGTPVVISGHGIQFKGDLVSEEGNKIKVEMNRFDGFPKIPSFLKESKGWTIDKAKTDIRHIVKGPIQNLAYNAERYNLIAGILSGAIRPLFDPDLLIRAEQIAPSTLNPSQRKAFIEAFASNNYYMIQGPPGTGKTWVLAHLAAAFANDGKNVLVTAFTHTGINNALKKVKEVTGYAKTAKIGKKYQADYLRACLKIL